MVQSLDYAGSSNQSNSLNLFYHEKSNFVFPDLLHCDNDLSRWSIDEKPFACISGRFWGMDAFSL